MKRVVDASTVQFEKSGYVSLESARGVGWTYVLPDCFSYFVLTKLRDPTAPPEGYCHAFGRYTLRRVTMSQATSSSPSRVAWIVCDNDEILINEDLVPNILALPTSEGFEDTARHNGRPY